MEHAWTNYVEFAWGKNELRPVSKRGHTASIFGSSSMGATIVDSLDTLYIMGMEEEFERGRNWVKDNLDMTKMVGNWVLRVEGLAPKNFRTKKSIECFHLGKGLLV